MATRDIVAAVAVRSALSAIGSARAVPAPAGRGAASWITATSARERLMSTVPSIKDSGHADATGEAHGPETGEAGEARGREAGETWVALLHRPGPAAPQDGSLFTDPRFGAHVQFLSRMQEAGYLVAAGPLTDEPGEGMAILRLPGEGQFETAVRLATQNDPSVACGFFTVTVRPWRVILQASPAAQPAS